MSGIQSKQDLDDMVAKIEGYIAGDQSKENLVAMRQALETSWPEVQKYLIEKVSKEAGHEGDPYVPFYTTNERGTEMLHASPDSWWLRNFRREDVRMNLPGVAILNTMPWHVRSVCNSLWDAYGEAEDARTETSSGQWVGGNAENGRAWRIR